MIFFRQLLLFLITINFVACASWLPDAHRMDITQGNSIKRADLNKIHTGMTMPQVTQIIGSPMLKDPFHAQRWDYIYRFIPGRGESAQSRLTLYFEDDTLVRIDDSEYREPESLEENTAAEPAPVEPVPLPQLD